MFLVLMTSLFSIPLSSQVHFSDTPDQITCKTGSYSLLISKSPFSVTVSNRENKEFRISGIVSDLPADDNLLKVSGSRNENESIVLNLVSQKGAYYSLLISLKKGELDFSLSPADRSKSGKLGFKFDLKDSGHWYGGDVVKGHLWPLETSKLRVDPFYATSNQVSPVWLSSNGIGLFADTYSTMGYSFNNPVEGVFEIWSANTERLDLRMIPGKDIRDAYYRLAPIVGKPSVTPPYDFFAYPQFNTWIEFMTNVNQDGITKYITEIRKNNFPARLFIIDDKWTTTYGDLEFDSKKFPDPEKMISFLHDNNFRIALWLTPFIEKKANNFQYALDHKYLIMSADNKSPYFAEWWNGTAAIVDLSNPDAYAWFLGMMKNLKEKYGVDGFKLDAGDAEFLRKPFSSYGKITTNEYTDLFAGLGTHFEANELRVSWRAQSMGLIERLRDKGPNWSPVDGIRSLIPHALTASLLGYSYVCPDMIGGGLDGGFKARGYKFDEELFVRWTEASALMPMMQYSLAPWKLSPENIAICRKYSELHVSLGNYIYDLAQKSRIDGTPVVRPLFFEFPADDQAFVILDEFMLGPRLLVAPVLEKGAVSRKIYLPSGTWSDFRTGKIYSGKQTIDYPAPLDVLPIFSLIN